MSGKGRRIASCSLLAGVTVTAVAAVAFRRQVEEEWHLFRLRSEDAIVRGQALSRLEQVGGDRSVAHLVRILLEDPSLPIRGWAVEVLSAIFPRLTSHHGEEAAIGLREAALAGNSRAGLVLREVGPQCAEIFPLLVDDLLSGRSTRKIAALVLFEAWPRSRDQILRCASEERAEALLGLMGSSLDLPFLSHFPNLESQDQNDRQKLLSRKALNAPAGFLAREHEDPLVRTVGLCFAVLRSSTDVADIDFDFLRSVFDKDPHRIPRRAALRIAGHLGPREDNLDLHRIIREEIDPELRASAIQARDLWSTGLYVASTEVELWDGVASVGLDRGLSPPDPRPWTEAELDSLEVILMTEKDPDLRDAASLALAGRYRNAPAPVASDLVVHEWGVWREGGGVLASTKAIDELPWFVHRSLSQVEDILDISPVHNFIVLKPVIFFHSPRPISVFLRVDFMEGRPWTFYPEITDYTGGMSGTSWYGESAVHPPWLRSSRTPQRKKDHAGELRVRYALAPWIVPGLSRVRGSWSGVGLEWCGLRVGYPAELEEELEPAEAPPWWGFLRAVPSTSVASRSDREKFVFYDGAVATPSPLRVTWEDASRQALLLRDRTGRLPAVFVIQRSARSLRGTMCADLSWRAPDSRVALSDLELEGEGLLKAFDGALRAAGLTLEEATSLVRTWSPEFFEAEGLRVITLLPRWIYDSMLPLRIAPLPGETVRVGLVWRECDDLGIGF